MDPLGRPGTETGWGRQQGLTNPDRRRDFWTVNNHFLRTQKWKEDDKRFFLVCQKLKKLPSFSFFFFQSISCVGLLQLLLCNSWWIYFQCETTIHVLKIKQHWLCAFLHWGAHAFCMPTVPPVSGNNAFLGRLPSPSPSADGQNQLYWASLLFSPRNSLNFLHGDVPFSLERGQRSAPSRSSQAHLQGISRVLLSTLLESIPIPDFFFPSVCVGGEGREEWRWRVVLDWAKKNF